MDVDKQSVGENWSRLCLNFDSSISSEIEKFEKCRSDYVEKALTMAIIWQSFAFISSFWTNQCCSNGENLKKLTISA